MEKHHWLKQTKKKSLYICMIVALISLMGCGKDQTKVTVLTMNEDDRYFLENMEDTQIPDDVMEAYIKEVEKIGGQMKPSEDTQILLDDDYQKENVDGYTIYTYSENNAYDKVFLYLHGGSFFGNIGTSHVKFCKRIAKQCNAKVILPDYPLLPNHTYKDCFDFMDTLYQKILEEEKDKEIVIAGDSAGGTIAMAFTEKIYEEGMPVPSFRLLISPCVDLTEENMELIAKYWSGGEDLRNPLLSPIFGDLSDGIPTLITVGGAENFYPSIMDMADRLGKNGCEVHVLEGENAFHVFPFSNFPMGDEARRMMAEAVK